MEENHKISKIVRTTRLQLSVALDRPISQEDFGDLLTEGLVNEISRTSVSAWENGKFEPDSDLLWALAVRHYGSRDWRLAFAAECLRAKLPDVFEVGIVNLQTPVSG